VGQEEGSLTPTEIVSSSEYESESESNTGSTLFPHYLPLFTPSSSPSTLPPLYTMSQCGQINYELLAQQQQKQLAALQVQIQALLAVQRIGGGGGASIEVAKPQVFDRTLGKISGFITVYKLYIRMKMRGVVVEEQI